jgi:hypothetical protein
MARSEYFDVASITLKPGHSTKIFNLFHTTSRRNYRITDSNEQSVYYVNNSHFTRSIPDVELFAGHEKSGPALGFAKFSSMFSKVIVFGLGDFHTGDSQRYELVRTSNPLIQSEFKFTIDSKTTFVWRRTTAASVGDGAAAYSLQNFILLDETTGETVATYANNGLKSWKKKGTLRLMEGTYGEDWEKFVLLTSLALIERARRRNRLSKMGAAGGSGGP